MVAGVLIRCEPQKETPVLEWRWKVVALPEGGNSCHKASDDQVAQVYVTWPRFPKAVRSRIIGYVWDTTAPVGTVCKSEKTGMVTYVVVRSGSQDAGKWVTERLFVAYRRRFDGDLEENANEGVLQHYFARDWMWEGTGGDRGTATLDLLWVVPF